LAIRPGKKWFDGREVGSKQARQLRGRRNSAIVGGHAGGVFLR